MGFGPKQSFVQPAAIASGASTSTMFDIGTKTYSKMAVKFPPSMSTAAMLTVYGCDTTTGTFLPVHERVNTAPVQYQATTIATTASGAWAVLDAPPFQYIKFIASATVTDGCGEIRLMLQD